MPAATTTSSTSTSTSADLPRKPRRGRPAGDPAARINVSFHATGHARQLLEAGAAARRQPVGRYTRDIAVAHLVDQAADHSGLAALSSQVTAMAADLAALRARLAP
jgi:hypothetical protein